MAEKPQEKSAEEIKAENDLMMAKAAIKTALLSFNSKEAPQIPPELSQYWNSLTTHEWREHLLLFARELKKYKQPKVKTILFDIENYVKDCKKLVPSFKRTKEEILLMMAIGQIKSSDFIETLSQLPSNREKLDRKIQKQIKVLDWEDSQDLDKLDDLTKQLNNPKIKKSEIEKIEKQITGIEQNIEKRKSIRDGLAIKLVEWKTRGTIDIAGMDGQFRLDA